MALANAPVVEPGDDLSPVSGRVASADLSADPAFVAPHISAVRVFRGYAGWGPGQLEGEIMAGAWLVFDAEPDDVFAAQPDRALAHRAAPPGRALGVAGQRPRRPQRELSLRSTRSATSACSAGTSR